MADSIRSLLVQGEAAISSDTPRLDAEILLAHVLGQSRSYLFAWPERCPDPEQVARYRELIARRQQGQPVAYLVGEREFWSLPLMVTPDVLIPRPETELLVELALQMLTQETARILELGTGSGAISLALASERPDWQIHATDISANALTIAQSNAQAHQCEHITFLQGDWYAALDDHADFDLIISNPPYIPFEDPHLDQGDLRFEPTSALIADNHGLADIEQIARGALERLGDGGWLLLEHGYQQGEAVRHILIEMGFSRVESRVDLAGHERATLGCKL